MRLTCPNCGAQYEVDPNVIPDSGRDVQCSNCGHTWYQRGPQESEAGPASAEPAESEPETVEDTVTGSGSADVGPDAAERGEPGDAPQRKPMDPGVKDILREEADTERAKREAEGRAAPSIETQTDLGLDMGTAETPPNIHERMARLREMEEGQGSASGTTSTASASRKELLPDIEEINSTLTPGDDDASDTLPATTPDASYRGGFRRGFALVIILFGVMLLVYIYAPRIVGINPATEPYLSAYVDWVNSVRASLDAFMSDAAARLTRLLSSINSSE